MLKRYIIMATLLVMVIGGCKPKEDKASKLAALKTQEADVKKQIAELEKDLNKGGDSAKNVPVVTVNAVQPSAFKHYIDIQGRVESDENVFVSPKIPGVLIKEVKVNRGDVVQKGQLLAVLDEGAINDQIAAMKKQLELAKTVYDKQKALWDQKIGSEIQYLNAKNQVDVLQKNIAAMDVQSSNFYLRAPFSGTVDDVNMHVGEMVVPGISGLRIVNYAKSKVVADVSEAYIDKVKKGDEVLVNFPDVNRKTTSRIKAVGRFINPSSRSFLIELDMDAKSQNLQPNMVSMVSINDYTAKNAITVPLNIIQNDENNKYVYVADASGKNKVAKKKIVKTGQSYNGMTEITEGLEANDMVITAGYQNVVEGMVISYK